jgi:hypothetical protein
MMVFSASSERSGCTKTNTVRDTVIRRDTTVIRDTLRIHDTTACEDLKDGLIAFYPFTNGSLKDSSGLQNDIYSNNATKATDRFGVANNAYSFNGTSNFMAVKNSASLNPKNISLVTTLKINAFNSDKCENNQVIGKGWPDYTNGFYWLRFRDLNSDCDPTTPAKTDKVVFTSGYGDNNQRAGAQSDTNFIKVGEWYTVIYTYDGYESRLYVNGKLVNITVKAAAFTPNINDLLIGKHQDPQYPYYFNGVIDEVRIYNKALCAEQIDELSNSSK